jgi:hypothetical protein
VSRIGKFIAIQIDYSFAGYVEGHWIKLLMGLGLLRE